MAETWYAVYEDATGVLVSVGTVLAPTDVLAAKGLSAVIIDGPQGSRVWDPQARSMVDPPPPTPPRVLSPLQFARLLTTAERISIRSSTDPIVVDFLWMLDRAKEVDLDDPDTQSGVGYLGALGLLTVARVARVLSGLPPEA